MFTTSVQLPSGSTQQQTLKVVEQMRNITSPMKKTTSCRCLPLLVLAPGVTGKTWRECLST
ncbi:hypothetical protein ACLB1N_34050 [Escherichia coli]